MARKIADADKEIIKLLQNQGLIRQEAEAVLKREVYQLRPDEIAMVKNYASHFGIANQDKYIQEILELRRELLLTRLEP